ncbi:hypothetical protein Q9189_007437 [Teloschistes chrysophthalmus]
MPESRAEDHETSSESSYKDMNEVAEPGSSAHHTPSPISESAVAELDPLDNAVQLSDERVATEPQSRESSVGEARPVIELSGIKKPHKEHTSVVDDARSGHASLSTPVQDFLQPSCGSKLYDDYLELRPGAAAQFELALNTPSQQRPSGPYGAAPGPDYYASSWPRGSGPSPGPLLPLSRTPNSASAPTTIGSNARNSQHSSATTVSEQESKWLLVCARAWRRPTSLIHLNVCSTSSDQQLFTELRRSYLQTKAWYHRFTLKAVQSIRFVQFELHPRDLVDIRKVPDMPSERRKDEYVYQACDLLPPVGENLMTHLFHHPHEANEKAITFLRSPKKRKQRLAVCPQAGTNLGWGIHLIEGYAMTRVWSLAFVMFLVSSMVFAIAWSVLEHDVQGAFAIAAYVVALVGLGVGTLQTYIA